MGYNNTESHQTYVYQHGRKTRDGVLCGGDIAMDCTVRIAIR